MLQFHTVFHFGARVILLIGRLAPLSIVIAALGILNTIRLARVKRRQDQAQAIRETLNAAGTSAYTLTWSLLGGMDIKVPLLELRDAIETRLGKPASQQQLLDLLADQLLIEPMIGKAWRDSGTIDRFRQQASDFSRLTADMGGRIPLVQEALEQINAQLRILLLADSALIVTIRNNRRYRNLPPARSGQPADPLHRICMMFLSDSQRPESEAFEKAAKFLSTLAAVTAGASDRRILRLLRPRLLPGRWRGYLATRAQERRGRTARPQIAAEFQKHFPQDAGLLTAALDAALRQTRDLRRKEKVLRESAAHILRTLRISGEDLRLKEATEDLVQVLSDEFRDKTLKVHALIRLKALGVADPEVDVHLATETGPLDLLKSAIKRGATTTVSREQVLRLHAQQLSGLKQILLN